MRPAVVGVLCVVGVILGIAAAAERRSRIVDGEEALPGPMMVVSIPVVMVRRCSTVAMWRCGDDGGG